MGRQMLASLAVTVLFLGVHVTLVAQTNEIRFDVASVKPQTGGPPSVPGPPAVPPNVFYRRGDTLASLIRYAYAVDDFQIEGGPDWLRKARFEVDAKTTAPVSDERMRQMVRNLLKDRFGIALHSEKRRMQVAMLVIARDDRKLGSHLQSCDVSNPPPAKSFPVPRGGDVVFQRCGTLATLVSRAIGIMGGPVVDRTGLEGTWAYDVSFARPTATTIEVPTFTTALEEQLGLKVQRGVDDVEFLIVDSVNEPSPN